MEIPLGVEVLCDGTSCGRSMALVMNPVTDEVTHIVVKEAHPPHTERMVPASAIERGEGGDLVLKTTTEELAGMEPFVDTYYIRTPIERFGPGTAYVWPYVMMHANEPHYIPERRERIPHGEVAVHRGAKVLASDGPVGKVDEFLVEKGGTHVTHLVMREGHLWGKEEVAIPVSKVDLMSEETVYLKLTRKEVGELPKIAVDRRY